MGRTKPMVSKEYIVGLSDGEGCFYDNVGRSSLYRTGFKIQLCFYIKMQEKDKSLLDKVKNTLNCGAVYFQKEQRADHAQCYRYTVNSQEDIFNVIIPFFSKYPLQSVLKRLNFGIFCQIANLVKAKAHLTKDGVAKIKFLKARMNQRTVGLA